MLPQVNYARNSAMRCAAEILQDVSGDVAELGVFQGDFAKEICSSYCVNKKRNLYLFDTFSGFSARDTEIEKECGFSDAREHEFNNTEINFVLSKMPYPDRCIVRQGYFPDTTSGLENNVFAFVSIDADLYKPTLEGLRYFYPRLSEGGIIFLHDYFTEDFWGVKEAVGEFRKSNNIRIVPIGDSCTIAIIR